MIFSVPFFLTADCSIIIFSKRTGNVGFPPSCSRPLYSFRAKNFRIKTCFYKNLRGTFSGKIFFYKMLFELICINNTVVVYHLYKRIFQQYFYFFLCKITTSHCKPPAVLCLYSANLFFFRRCSSFYHQYQHK